MLTEKTLYFICDLHIGAAKDWGWTVDELIEFDKSLKDDETLVLGGDIFDFKQMLKDDVYFYYAQYKKLADHFKERLVLGNHCGDLSHLKKEMFYSYIWVVGELQFLIDHGHRSFWPYEKPKKNKVIKWETSVFDGAKKWKHNLMKLVSWYDEKYYRKELKEKPELLSMLDKYSAGFNGYFFGHKHVKKPFYRWFNKKQFIGGKRGLNKIKAECCGDGRFNVFAARVDNKVLVR